VSRRPRRLAAIGLGLAIATGAGIRAYEVTRTSPAAPFRHLDGSGALGSVGQPVEEGSAVDPRDGSTSWTFGIPLCARDPNEPATIERILPATSVGDVAVLGSGIRSFTPNQSNTPIVSTNGYPPPVPDAISPAIGYRVTTRCSNRYDLPYTELLIGLAQEGDQGGGWRGVDVAYTAAGGDRVLHLDRVLLICGPITDDDCLGKPFATPRGSSP
jgi:hypothetical protein